jgi:hypothetical protein
MNSFDKFRIRLIKSLMRRYGLEYEGGTFFIDDQSFTSSNDLAKYFISKYGGGECTITCEENHDLYNVYAFESTSEMIDLILENKNYFESLF